SLSVPGLLGIAAVAAILVVDALPSKAPTGLVAGFSVLIVSTYLLITAVLDESIAGLGGGVEQVGPTTLTAAGSSKIWRFTRHGAENRVIAVAYALLTALALALLFLAANQHGKEGNRAAVLFVVSLMIAGNALIRLCPIAGFPGGVAGRKCMTLFGGDEDAVGSAALIVSYFASVTIALAGLLIVAHPGSWGPWGVACLVLGIDCTAVTHWQGERTRWAEKASQRTLGSLRFSRLPTVSRSAPVSELFSIFAVEGNRATIVVTDEKGLPCGLIELRHLKSAARTGQAVHPNELMVTLSEIPRFACESTVLEAAISLEHRGLSALVTECAEDKLRVISLNELLRLGE
ncbi:MAG: hypothetical protein AB7G88_08565, partial [Thermomicrobiales bacterium]